MQEHKEQVQIRNKTIKYRNWKVKDKNAFINALSQDDIDVQEAQNILVYNCLENKNTVLNTEEFRFMIHKIRTTSISDDFSFSYTCEECQSNVDNQLKISETIKMHVLPYTDIIVDDVTIELGDIPNKEFYDGKIKECKTENETYLVDFLYRIKSWNKNKNFTFDELIEYFDDLDINTSDAILKQWDAQRVQIQDTLELTCTSCQHKEQFKFDEIPEFFPSTWFE